MAHRLAIFLVLTDGDSVLFGLHQGTGYRDGEYGLLAGKVDEGETTVEALLREASEEVGIHVDESDAQLVHISDETPRPHSGSTSTTSPPHGRAIRRTASQPSAPVSVGCQRTNRVSSTT